MQGLNAPSGRVCRQSALCRNLSGTFSISRVAQASPFVASPQALQKPIQACGNSSINRVKLSISQYPAAAIMRVHYAQAYANLCNQHHFSHACSSAAIRQQQCRQLSANPPSSRAGSSAPIRQQPCRLLSANPPAATQAAQRQSASSRTGSSAPIHQQQCRLLSANPPSSHAGSSAPIRHAQLCATQRQSA